MDLDKHNSVKSACLVLGLSQLCMMPQLLQNIVFASKVDTRDTKIIISLCWFKSMTHSRCKINNLIRIYGIIQNFRG